MAIGHAAERRRPPWLAQLTPDHRDRGARWHQPEATHADVTRSRSADRRVDFWAGVNSITVPRSSSGADIRYGLDLAGPISVATGSPAKETGARAADADIRYANGPPEGRRARRGADGGTGSERYH